MKKLFVFLFLICCLGATFAFKNEKTPIFAFNEIDEVCFVDDKNYENLDLEAVNCGDLVFNFCSLSVARENFSKIDDAKAVQIYLSDISLEEILKKLDAKIVSEENVQNIQIINAYTPHFSKSVFVEHKKVNLQIAFKDGQIVAGFPMILTGF